MNNAAYLVYACRLTGWLEIACFSGSTVSNDNIKVFRELFHCFGVPEEISLDDGPNLDAKATLAFLNLWGVQRRLSSAYYPQSNVGLRRPLKTAKHILSGNTSFKGNLNTDTLMKALMQYRNIPLKGTKTSPAQLALSRSIRDFIPQPPSGYRVSSKWGQFLCHRELAMLKEATIKTRDSNKNPSLNELSIGTEVLLQNVSTSKWDRSGIVVESCGFRQYKVKVHGSG